MSRQSHRRWARPTLFLLSFFCVSAVAQQNVEIDTTELEYSGLQVQSVAPTKIEGLYQIITNQGLFYVSKDGTQLIAGNLFDLSNTPPRNLTEQTMTQLRRQKLAELTDEMVVYPSSDEKFKVTVFTDTTCTYCQRLHENLGQYLDKGITVRYLAFPRGGMDSRGARELQQVWCSDNPQQTLTKLKNGDSVDTPRCDNPVAEHYRLGKMLGVTGTPAVVLPDGRMLPGLRTPDALLEAMQ